VTSNGRRGSTWGDDARGGISAIILEALIVVVLLLFAVLVSFIFVTVV
jgi:hypothetical protein